MFISKLTLLFMFLVGKTAAFAPAATRLSPWGTPYASLSLSSSSGSSTATFLFDPSSLSSSSPFSVDLFLTNHPVSLLLSAVDSDLVQISRNPYTPIFLGGISIMLGSILGVFVVAYILEKYNLYSRIVAESYAKQVENDEEFWKRMSEEERKMTRELLDKIEAKKKEKKTGNNIMMMLMKRKDEAQPTAPPAAVETAAPGNPEAAATKEQETVETKKLDVFSDY